MTEDRIIGRLEVARLTGLSPTTIWRLMNCGEFPLKLHISQRRVGWRLSEVLVWLDQRKATSNQAGGRK